MGHIITLFQKNKIIIRANFNGADNPASLGITDTGQAWTVLGACTWAILNGKAVQTNVVTTTAVLAVTDDPSLTNPFTLSAKVTFQTNEGLAFRIQDITNYLTVRLSSVGLGLFKIIAGSATQLGSYALTPVVGTVYTIKIRANGSNIAVYLDGLQVITVSETLYQTLTKVGIREATPNLGNGAFDDFLVEAL